MTADAKQSYRSTMLLIALGLVALYGGARWLLLVIPAAALVWHTAAELAGRTRL